MTLCKGKNFEFHRNIFICFNLQSEASQTPSSCRQRMLGGDLQAEGLPDTTSAAAMESGYLPVPTSSGTKHESSV